MAFGSVKTYPREGQQRTSKPDYMRACSRVLVVSLFSLGPVWRDRSYSTDPNELDELAMRLILLILEKIWLRILWVVQGALKDYLKMWLSKYTVSVIKWSKIQRVQTSEKGMKNFRSKKKQNKRFSYQTLTGCAESLSTQSKSRLPIRPMYLIRCNICVCFPFMTKYGTDTSSSE